eukprot:sb/3461988/
MRPELFQLFPSTSSHLFCRFSQCYPFRVVCAMKCRINRTGSDVEGQDRWPYAGAAGAVKAMGGQHIVTDVNQTHIDTKNKVVTTPAFMCDTAVHEIYDGVGTGLWLVKVPKYVSDRLKMCDEGDQFGVIKTNRTAAGTKISFDIDQNLCDKVSEDKSQCPSNHDMRLGTLAGPNRALAVYSEGEEVIHMEGVIKTRFDVYQNQNSSRSYLSLKRFEAERKAMPERTIKFNTKTVNAFKPSNVSQKQLYTTKAQREEKSANKRIRLDRATVENMILKAFKKNQYISQKNLLSITGQPENYLKEFLGEMCVYNNKAPHKNTWELKPEYRHYDQTMEDEISGDPDPTEPPKHLEEDFRSGRRFGSIAAVKLSNPVTKKKALQGNRKVTVFVHDVYRNVRVRKVEVSAVKEPFLSKVEIEENRCIFVEIPSSRVALVNRELYKKCTAQQETWVLEKPSSYKSPPKFIDEGGTNETDADAAYVKEKLKTSPKLEMSIGADIVFAPYNYILDPLIVSQRKLDLNGHIAIFDEGHNIEDVCRSSAGFDATQFEIGEAIDDVEKCFKNQQHFFQTYGADPSGGCAPKYTELNAIKSFLVQLRDFTTSFEGRLIKDYFEHSHYSLDGVTCLRQLQAIGITSDYVDQLGGWIGSIFAEIEEDKGKPKSEKSIKPPRPKTSSLIVVEKFMLTYKILQRHPDSFTLCVSTQFNQSPSYRLSVLIAQLITNTSNRELFEVVVLIPSVTFPLTSNRPTQQPIRTRYLGHMTGYQPIRDQYSPSQAHQLQVKKSPLFIEDPHGGRGSRNKQRIIGLTLSLSCLNPAVVFKPLSEKCHSVIVTSGMIGCRGNCVLHSPCVHDLSAVMCPQCVRNVSSNGP